jgi:hypothetical protein
VNARVAVRFGEKMPTTRSHEGGDGVEPDRELILEDARSIREGLWLIARYAQEAAELMDERIDAEELDGSTEVGEVREILERVRALSLELSEELDAYQTRHAR